MSELTFDDVATNAASTLLENDMDAYLFPVGNVVTSELVSSELEKLESTGRMMAVVHILLEAHRALDQGLLDDEDHEQNKLSVEHGDRILSSFPWGTTSELPSVELDESYKRVWLITESDRSATTILFPEEY